VSLVGPKLPTRNVRYSVAMGGKADVEFDLSPSAPCRIAPGAGLAQRVGIDGPVGGLMPRPETSVHRLFASPFLLAIC